MAGTEIEAMGHAGGENLRRLKALLAELFMFDQADLDFGIYRIMNLRRDEIRRFLADDLLTQVHEALGVVAAGTREATEVELRALEKELRDDGIDPQSSRRFRELEARHAKQPDLASAEEEVYSHLVTFFRRYYKEGDFISLRRYKEGVYAIPYEGEEVKLHWANSDQYYVKTAEHFRDYTYLLSDGRRVHFKLVEAGTETNNNRAQNGNDRRFILADEEPVVEQDGELVVRFEYRPDPDGRKRDELNSESIQRILDDPAAAAWQVGLGRDVRPDGAKEPLSALRKHLNAYTAKNEFDYFIHKDLGGFLRRELDFYLKNEVMHLDDIDQDGKSAPDVELHLDKMRAIRRVGHKTIDFLAQLEDFQKRLWLKKKFVVETHWCVTLDRVPEDLYDEVAANDRQREEWVRLFAIDEITGDMVTRGYSEPLDVEFLRSHPYLVVDTSFFAPAFTERLLSNIEDLDESTDGLLVHSENFQALNLLSARYRGAVDCVYIDPPYNTVQASEILYKNSYKHSSWLSLIADRILMSIGLATPEAPHCIAIDDYELPRLLPLCQDVFADSDVNVIVVNHHAQGAGGHNVSRTHEYMIVTTAPGADVLRLPRDDAAKGDFERRPYRRAGTGDNNFRFGRPNSFFALLVDPSSMTVVGIEPPPIGDDYPRENTDEGYVRIYPIGEGGVERVWRQSYESATASVAAGESFAVSEQFVVYRLLPRKARSLPPSNWADSRYNAGTHGANLLADMLGTTAFAYPKSLYTVRDAIDACTWETDEPIVLDYFAGSGTTAHAAIEVNREDGGGRKYVLVEVGEYFDTVMKPRVLKAVYSRDWKDGKPVSREGVSQLMKVVRLESYEDSLNNLDVSRTEQQQSLLDTHEGLRKEYMLRYWLDVETRGSASLLDVDQFDDPWSYTLDVAQGSAAETRQVAVDLVETFNYLIGLHVRHVDVVRSVTTVQGTLPSGEKALVIWRKVADMPSEELDRFLFSQPINPRDMEFDVIYVNGDNHLENTRRPGETWKVHLIEEEFLRLMFETADRA